MRYAIQTPASSSTLLIVEATNESAALAQVDSAPGTILSIWTLGNFPARHVRLADGSLQELPRETPTKIPR
jgi:hypothetical protein